MSFTVINSEIVKDAPATRKDAVAMIDEVSHAMAITYISGTGTVGSDNTDQNLQTLSLPANTLKQIGDRMRIRAYWKGDTGSAITGMVSVNGVTVADITDGGGADFRVTESWIHYIDATHANIIEQHADGLGALTTPNVSGFNWANAQNIIFNQNQIANNHITLYALIIDVLPKGSI